MSDEIDRIIMKLPSIVDRGKLFSHVAILEERAQTGNENASEEEVEAIIRWIRSTWTTETVRSKLARKVARLIEEGEYKKKTA